MKRPDFRLARKRLVIVGLLFAAVSTSATLVVTNVWTGLGATGWRGGIVPAYNGTDILGFGNTVNPTVPLPVGASINTFLFGDNDDYVITSATSSPITVTLNGGLQGTGSNYNQVAFDANVNLALSGTPTFDAGNYTFFFTGQLTGTGSLKLTSSTGNGGFGFNNTGAGNTYSGGTTVSNTFVAFWNSSPFGTGPVTVTDSATFIGHYTPTVSNALTLNASASPNATLGLRSWDGTMTFSGNVTLASNATLSPKVSWTHVDAANHQGSFLTPGAATFNPVIFSGNIGESAAGKQLTVTGQAPLVLTGTSTYTGGTIVGGASGGGGILMFGAAAAAPGTGTVLVNTSGYMGLGDPTVIGANGFSAFALTHVDPASSGAIGIDTVPGYYGGTIASTEQINLSSTGGNGTTPLGFTNAAIRLGAASTVYLSYPFSLTPQGTNYQFGNGGGTIYLQAPLSDTAGNGAYVAGRALTMTNDGSGAPLKLFLQGANYSYTGGTVANNGFIIFDSLNANGIPTTGAFTAAGSSSSTGGSYIGYTDSTALLPATFLAKFDKTNTWGIVGFDTKPGGATVSLTTPINLTGFNNGVFVGTATSATLNGAFTPTADGILRLTAANGGTLTVTDALASAASLVLGSPASNEAYSNGTIFLNSTSGALYTGGTTINSNGSLTIKAGNASAFGSGPITLAAGNGGVIGLQTTTAFDLWNSITFQAPGAGQAAATLDLASGPSDFYLSSTISGTGTINLIRDAAAAGTRSVTLAGNNLSFAGEINLQNSTLVLGHNNAVGSATVHFHDANSIIQVPAVMPIDAIAPNAPVLHGISGDKGRIILPASNGVNLTFDVSDHNTDHDFGGTITGPGGGATNATLTVTGTVNPAQTTELLYLYGANTYTGDVYINGQAALGLGAANSVGSTTSTIHINVTDGGLALNKGVVLTNPLDLQSGGLGGVGTFAPASINGVVGGPLAIGTGKLLLPGIPGNHALPGQMTLNANLEFATGGTFRWLLQDAGRIDGFSSLVVNGALNLTAGAGQFTFELESIDASGAKGMAAMFDSGGAYSWTVLTTTGGITGFNPTLFTIDVSRFQLGTVSAAQFALSQSGNNLVLTYAVPEPSAYALLGLGLVGLAWRSRRRAV